MRRMSEVVLRNRIAHSLPRCMPLPKSVAAIAGRAKLCPILPMRFHPPPYERESTLGPLSSMPQRIRSRCEPVLVEHPSARLFSFGSGFDFGPSEQQSGVTAIQEEQKLPSQPTKGFSCKAPEFS